MITFCDSENYETFKGFLFDGEKITEFNEIIDFENDLTTYETTASTTSKFPVILPSSTSDLMELLSLYTLKYYVGTFSTTDTETGFLGIKLANVPSAFTSLFGPGDDPLQVMLLAVVSDYDNGNPKFFVYDSADYAGFEIENLSYDNKPDSLVDFTDTPLDKMPETITSINPAFNQLQNPMMFPVPEGYYCSYLEAMMSSMSSGGMSFSDLGFCFYIPFSNTDLYLKVGNENKEATTFMLTIIALQITNS